MSAAATGNGTGLVPSAYADAFTRGPPREGVQRVQTRLHKARILTDELADYFAARRELESSYLKSLQKIAKRSFLSDPSALGQNFLPVYERLVAEIGEIARIHGDLEKRLEVECEAPMRNASAKGDWARIKEHDDNLSGTLKEINTLESQLAKDQKKVESSSAKKVSQANQKVAETERALRQTMELWETEAPFAFEAYQRIDAQRLELMKEVVAKFETVQSDAAQRTMQMTEQSMQIALNFDPQEDMQEFVLRNGTTSSILGRSQTATVVQTRTNRTPSVTVSGAPNAGIGAGAANASTLSASTPTASEYPNNGINEFGRPMQQTSASIHSNDRSTGQDQSSTMGSKLGGSTLKSALTRFGRGRTNRNVNEATTYGTLAEGPARVSSPSDNRTQDQPLRRSTDSRRSDVDGSGALPGSLMAPMAPTTLPTPSKGGPLQLSSSSMSPAREVDAEGFTIPPANRDRKPWELGAIDTGTSSSGLMGDNEEASESLDINPPSAGGRVTGMSIAQQSIRDDDASEQAALERMRSTLLTARSPAMAPPHRRNTTRRDRRDVRNTTYNPVAVEDGNGRPASAFGLPMVGSSPTQATASPSSAFTATPGIGPERTQSIVSSGSASNVGNATLDTIATSSGPIAHGLNAQITERVNVVLHGRTVAKIMVVGEISVSARDVSVNEPLHMRVDSFEQLEKAAPNPQFMKELSGKPGEYSLDVAAIMRQGGKAPTWGAGRVTVLKYQLHVPAHRANEYVPIHVTPQWRCEDKQTSILINYAANAEARVVAAASADASGAAVQDITISTDVTSPGVSNVMSKPSAVYVAEQKKLFWRLQDHLPVAAATDGTAAAARKALARFTVEAKGEPRPVEVRWKLPGLTASSLGVSLVDAGEVSFSIVARQVVSGKYVAHP